MKKNVFAMLLLLLIFLSPMHTAAGDTSDITIKLFGGGFESSWKGTWIYINGYNKSQVYCTDSGNPILTWTRQPGVQGDKEWARWRPTIPQSGIYRIHVFIPDYYLDDGANRPSSQVRYQITYSGGSTTKYVDQNNSNNKCGRNGDWYILGDFPFDVGTSGNVYMGDYTGDSIWQVLSADSMRFEWLAPVPSLSSINPSSVLLGGGNFTLDVYGSNFQSSSIVQMNGAGRTTTYIDPGHLQAAILSSDITTAGSRNISVYTPAPGGGTSGTIQLTVANPAPAISTISPTSVLVNSGSFTLHVYGSNFLSSSIVRLNGADRTTTYIDAGHLQAAILSSDLTAAGSRNISVFTPAPGGGTSGTVPLTVANPAPTLTSINPTTVRVNSAGIALDVYGSNFISGSVVRLNGSNRTTTYIDAGHLKAAILNTDLNSVGTRAISVFNAAPGGGTSSVLQLTISKPLPTWTFMIYLAGDNELTSFMNDAITSMETLPPNSDINIVVLYDKAGNNNTYKFKVQPGGKYTLGVDRWYLGELNMGSYKNLADFIVWAREQYPADHYYLSVADHGKGTEGIAWDYGSNNEYITSMELASALNTATNGGQQKIDIVHLDACLMGMLETADNLKNYANYLIASENLTVGIFAYDQYSQVIDPSPERTAINIAQAYFNNERINLKPRTISVLNLSATQQVVNAFNTLSIDLWSKLGSIKTNLQNVRSVTQKFDTQDYNRITDTDEYLDLVNFAEKINAYISDTTLKTDTQNLINLVKGNFVIANYRQNGTLIDEKKDLDIYINLDNANGVAVYFPPQPDNRMYGDYQLYINDQVSLLSQDTKWVRFLTDYFGLLNLPPGDPVDPGIPPVLPGNFMVYIPIAVK